jgi:hypothetical protein
MNANEVAPEQPPHRDLHRAFRKARGIGNRLMAQARALFPAAYRLMPQVQVHQEGGWRAIVAYKIAHQHFEDVVVNLNSHYSGNNYSIKNGIVKRPAVA